MTKYVQCMNSKRCRWPRRAWPGRFVACRQRCGSARALKTTAPFARLYSPTWTRSSNESDCGAQSHNLPV
eukprot:scaffold18312_cov55-Attheya_sp.AAC.2